jgi:hypothetical protein
MFIALFIQILSTILKIAQLFAFAPELPFGGTFTHFYKMLLIQDQVPTDDFLTLLLSLTPILLC